MRNLMKLIAITAMTALLLFALITCASADEKIYTSPVFKLPPELLEQADELIEAQAEEEVPEESDEVEDEDEFDEDEGLADLDDGQVDRGDGKGWVDVDSANDYQHSFIANRETIQYSWQLIVTIIGE